ncbi:LacI family DNA-binding transcriptional regulator [Prevotella dentasini]|uniref:LacI family DNA-binding transcriptional regulator n=1 Tax=Prevotella dentasini TaxID=589537 RepID=UPI0004683723|nr:substrate-binding domain-containing protein [Prevotella dentasini]
MADKIRIKDIAERAGVSVGTVDRVLHKRPNVSKDALEKVERVLREMNYQPNVYASALAYNRSYTFFCLIPKHASEAYWEEIELGVMKAVEQRRDFHVNAEIMYYSRLHSESFVDTYTECLSKNPDGVILVPSTLELTRDFTDKLHARRIPFILLDSYMPELNPLSFYGQDSFQSGRFSARMLMLIARDEKAIMLMKQTKDGKVPSKQQENREVGFRHYMKDNFPNVEILEVNLPLDEERKRYDGILERFFSSHPEIHHCVALNSKAHIVGSFLLKTNRRNIQIMGYDVVHKNADCLREGSISFLIAQHAYQQGYYSVDTLFRAIVLKKEVRPVNYMPIELLTRENIDFYHRSMI